MAKKPTWSQEKYIKALYFAAQAHRGQTYPGSGLSYLLHISLVCMETIAALEVEDVEDPDLTVQCALLHDVIEDTRISKQKIEEVFGREVANGVALLSKDNEITDHGVRDREYMRKLEKGRTEIKMIKLADRISNLQKPPFDWDQSKIREYMQESLVILNKLGEASPYLTERLSQKIEEYAKNVS